MADQNGKGIAWTQKTWNPVRGCRRISPGCLNCYAERIAARFSGKGLAFEGLAKRTPAGPRWTGAASLVEDHLFDPIRWRTPARVFVNSMSDLFYEAFSVEEIAQVFAVMSLAHHHTFQLLTKRSARMREVLSAPELYNDVLRAAEAPRKVWPKLTGVGISDPAKFPARNVWLGVSVENQEAAEERVPELLATPAAVRWLSVEPQIGPVDLSKWLGRGNYSAAVGPLVSEEKAAQPTQSVPELSGKLFSDSGGNYAPRIDWVVIGGESGKAARPFEIRWARDLVEQCRGAGVRVFVKQLGDLPILPEPEWRLIAESVMGGGKGTSPEAGWLLNARTRERVPSGFVGLKLSKAGGEPAEWPADLRVREYPGEVRG